MDESKIEQRLAELEKQVWRLTNTLDRFLRMTHSEWVKEPWKLSREDRLALLKPGPEDWKITVGLFDNLGPVFDEAMKLREAERQEADRKFAKRAASRKRRPKAAQAVKTSVKRKPK